MATVLEQVRIVLGLETKGFGAVSGQLKGVHQGVERSLSQLKTAVAGYFTIAAGRELIRSVSTMAERWKDIAEQTGLSTDAVQKYDAAFKKVGLSAEDAAAAFEILTQKRREALEEGGAAAQLFRAFGVSEEELRGLESGAAIFERLGRGRSASNQGDRELFGQMFGTKRGGKMLAGANSLEEGGELSLMSKEDIQTIDDASKRFEAAARDFKIASAPLVTALTNWVTTAMRFWGSNPDGGESQRQAVASLAKEGVLDVIPGGAFARKLIGSLRGKNKGETDLAGVSDQIRGGGQMGYNETVASIIGSGGPASGGLLSGVFSADAKRAKDKLNEAIFGTLFKAGNTGQQKSLLNQQMKDLLGQAESEKDPVKAAGLKGEAFKLAGNLAELNRTQSGMFAPDSLAAVGGIIGGAGIAADPGLNIETSQLEELRKVVSGIDALEKAWRDSPMNQLR